MISFVRKINPGLLSRFVWHIYSYIQTDRQTDRQTERQSSVCWLVGWSCVNKMNVLTVYYFVAMDTTSFCGYIGLLLNHQFLVTWILEHLAYPPHPPSILLNLFF